MTLKATVSIQQRSEHLDDGFRGAIDIGKETYTFLHRSDLVAEIRDPNGRRMDELDILYPLLHHAVWRATTGIWMSGKKDHYQDVWFDDPAREVPGYRLRPRRDPENPSLTQ